MDSKKGFTLIEVMVVISIIAMLSSIVLGFVNGARDTAKMSAIIQFDTNIKHTIGERAAQPFGWDEPRSNF